MAEGVTHFSNYLLADSQGQEYVQLNYKLTKAHFEQVLGRILTEYGLAERLKQAKLTNSKLHILDIGCAEGLYLHEIARVLDTLELTDAAYFSGIDLNSAAISIAEEFAGSSVPPRPYFNFYLYDATQPLPDCQGLNASNGAAFDFILVMSTLLYLPDARTHLTHFYELLKPGGVIYLRNVATLPGPAGWMSPHPLADHFQTVSMNFIRQVNGGIDVATEAANWLETLGAEQIDQTFHTWHYDGATPEGLQVLRLFILLIRASAPTLINQGWMTQDEYDELMQNIFRNFSPDLKGGQWTYVETLARKPQ
jgi:SAM-dependent methyltransferase